MKQTFEDFLMEKQAEDYIGTKDCMVDDFPDWLMELDVDDLVKYGDEFAKEQSKVLLEALKSIIQYPDVVKTIGTELFNNAQQAIAKASAEGGSK